MAGAVAVAACFCASLLFGALALGRLHGEAHAAATNGIPSTEQLSKARTDLRKLEGAMSEAVTRLMRRQPFDGSALTAARQALQADLDAYLALPQYPGEAEQFDAVVRDLAHLDEVSSRLTSIIGAGDFARALEVENDQWRYASDHLSASLQQLQLFNVRHVSGHLDTLEQSAEWTLVGLLVGGLLSVLVTILAVRVTGRAVQERERVLKARADEWEAFSARVAHDLTSPLQTVAFAFNVAHERCHDEEVAKMNVRGRSALARIRATVDALFNFARAGGQPMPGERARVREVVARLLAEVRPSAEEQLVELSAEAVPDSEVACSPGTLHIILFNLVQNAIKYIGDRPGRRVVVKVSATARRTRIEVHDSGPGLDSEAESEVFKPYVRGAMPGVAGLGLGLATVKRIADSHGGSVGVRSKRGQGSVFWIELPNAASPSSAPASANPAQPAPPGNT